MKDTVKIGKINALPKHRKTLIPCDLHSVENAEIIRDGKRTDEIIKDILSMPKLK